MTPKIISEEAQITWPQRYCLIKGGTIDDLKKMDMWSLSMILFLLLNPDSAYPYENEVKN